MTKRGRFRIIKGSRRDWSKHGAYQRQRSGERRPKGGGRRGGLLRYAPLWLGAILVGLAVGVGPNWSPTPSKADPTNEAGVRASFGYCHTGGGYNCVVDGDTIWLEGQNIRIADIDAPETHEPRCLSEKALGDRATQKLHQLVNSGRVTLERIDRDQDNYGRLLRIVNVDGVSVGETLVDEGFARWYAGGRRPWC